MLTWFMRKENIEKKRDEAEYELEHLRKRLTAYTQKRDLYRKGCEILNARIFGAQKRLIKLNERLAK